MGRNWPVAETVNPLPVGVDQEPHVNVALGRVRPDASSRLLPAAPTNAPRTHASPLRVGRLVLLRTSADVHHRLGA